MGKADKYYQEKLAKLTPKQRKFAETLVKETANTKTEAYREAYEVGEGTSPNTVRVAASRLSRSPNVGPAIEAGKEAERARELAAAGSRRRWIVERLVSEASEADSDAARVRALELLARQAGLFDGPESRSVARSSATESALLQELQARLSAAFPGFDAAGTGEVVDLPGDGEE